MRSIITVMSLLMLTIVSACVVAPAYAPAPPPAVGVSYYPGPYVAHPAYYGGYYYRHGYGYYR